MFKTLKNFFSRKTRTAPACEDDSPHPHILDATRNTQHAGHSSIRPISPISSPPPTPKDASPRPHILDAPRTTQHAESASTLQQFNASTSSIPIDPDNKRNGKIAKLPRHIRDHINRAFDAGQSAVSIAEQLNKLPEVKAALNAHFGGRPITQQNLSEWKAGGYRDWQLRQELLYKQQELAADAQEMAKIAHGMDDSLFSMALLDYARLMKNADKDTPEEFEKKRKALSNMINDIVRLRRCQNQTRGVEVQEERLERDREKTTEEMFLKFMEWASNPEIRRAFILEPMVAMALQRRHFGLPPRPEDAAVLKEYDLAKAVENQGNPTEYAPPRTENSEAPATATESEPSPEPEQVGRVTPCAPSSPTPTSEDVAPDSQIKNGGPVNSPSPQRESGSQENPTSAHCGAEQPTNSKPKTQNSTLPASPTPDAALPSPELLAERKREREEFCRQAALAREERLRQSKSESHLPSWTRSPNPVIYTPQSHPIPASPPPPPARILPKSIFPESRDPSDNWRCHTS